MANRICTKDTPARPVSLWNFSAWNWEYTHPDAKKWCVDDVHEDWRYKCPNCGQTYVAEGSDY